MSKQFSGNPPVLREDKPFLPSRYYPWSNCECTVPQTCGAPQNYSVKGVGGFYSVPYHSPFSAWTGQLVKHDMNPPKKMAYVPPSPCHTTNVLCERPRGAQACSTNSGSDLCPP